ncbi:MAG TPA: tRNA (adenosine(37)-N6)-threonylcarbamoyltransferase complex ATPase subunit type 1 TsaE, partial [Candidatus Saccharimonadia bacterium]
MIELKGDVGSGKTTLTQGIAAGLGFSGEVSSPTFTLSRAYPLKDGSSLHHFDFYRLKGHDIATEELYEVTQDPTAIVVIEWPGQGAAKLPARRLRITIAPLEQENHRSILLESLAGGGEAVIGKISHDT